MSTPAQAPQRRVLTPRGEFMQVAPYVGAHRKLLDSPEWKRGKEAALAEYTRAVVALAGDKDLSATGCQQAQAACFQMISGAHSFLEVFERLADPYQTQAGKPTPIESLE